MSNTKISDLGSRRIAISGLPEIRKTALGNGTAKPGDVVGVASATGKVAGSDDGAFEYFEGIVDDDPTIAEDTAIADGSPLSLIVPQSGHLYRVHTDDPGGAALRGTSMGFGAGAGALDQLDELNDADKTTMAYLEKDQANGDTVAEVRWK
jgi:hypothetical protein